MTTVMETPKAAAPTATAETINISEADFRWLFWFLACWAGFLILWDEFRWLCQMNVWALGDNGGHIVLDRLLRHGWLPNIDFGYPYGPASILLNQAWTSLFGAHWLPFFVLQLLLRAILICQTIFILRLLRFPTASAALLLLVLPHFWGLEFSIAHACEKIGLFAAVHFLLLGRPAAALAALSLGASMRTVAPVLFAAPLLAWQALVEFRQEKWWVLRLHRFFQFVLPALLVQIVVASLFIFHYGFASFSQTLIPWLGMKMYAAKKVLGPWQDTIRYFQELPRCIWYEPSQTQPLWLLLIFLLALPNFWYCFRNTVITTERESQADLAFCGLAFACIGSFAVAYGGGVYYYYYYPLFWFALLNAYYLFNSGRHHKMLPLFLSILLGILGYEALGTVRANATNPKRAHSIVASSATSNAPTQFTTVQSEPIDAAVTTAAHSQQLNSFLQPTQAQLLDLAQIRQIIQDKPLCIMTKMGDVSLWEPFGFQIPPNWFWCLHPGLNTDREIAVQAEQLRQYPYVLIERKDQVIYVYAHLQNHQLIFEGRFFALYYKPAPEQG